APGARSRADAARPVLLAGGGGMKRLRCHFAALAALVLAGAPARAATDDVPLVADLSSHLVAITTGFTGASVLLFGATNGPGDIAIVIHGPAKDIAVRRMARL